MVLYGKSLQILPINKKKKNEKSAATIIEGLRRNALICEIAFIKTCEMA